VAEDYAAFDVNVTNEAVPLDRITRSGSADSVFGTTVLITQRKGVYSCNCGGVAYVGIFNDTSDYYKPALVFYDALGSGNEKYVAEAISHEAGHNMGLVHDGYSSGGYYQGHGSGATGWAPIMGVGYYQSLVQWSKGEYASANNVQDDYAVMQSKGLPLRADDHGDTAGTATVLDGDSRDGLTGLSATGVIERPTDIDTFAFSAGAGTATYSVVPAARSANLDVMVTLRDAAGTLLASVNPADALNARFSVALPAAGAYFRSPPEDAPREPGGGLDQPGALHRLDRGLRQRDHLREDIARCRRAGAAGPDQRALRHRRQRRTRGQALCRRRAADREADADATDAEATAPMTAAAASTDTDADLGPRIHHGHAACVQRHAGERGDTAGLQRHQRDLHLLGRIRAGPGKAGDRIAAHGDDATRTEPVRPLVLAPAPHSFVGRPAHHQHAPTLQRSGVERGV